MSGARWPSVVDAAEVTIVGIAAEPVRLVDADSGRRRRRKRKRSRGPTDRRELVHMSLVLVSRLSAGRRGGHNQGCQRDHKGQRAKLKGRHSFLHLSTTRYRTVVDVCSSLSSEAGVLQSRQTRCDHAHKSRKMPVTMLTGHI